MDLEPCTRKTWSNGQNEIRVGLILDCLELFIMCQDILIRPKDVIVSWTLLVFHVMTHPACSEIVEMIFFPIVRRRCHFQRDSGDFNMRSATNSIT